MIVVIPVTGHVTVALRTGALVLHLQIFLDILPNYFCLSSLCNISFMTSGEILLSLARIVIYSLIKSFLSLEAIDFASLNSLMDIFNFPTALSQVAKWPKYFPIFIQSFFLMIFLLVKTFDFFGLYTANILHNLCIFT